MSPLGPLAACQLGPVKTLLTLGKSNRKKKKKRKKNRPNNLLKYNQSPGAG